MFRTCTTSARRFVCLRTLTTDRATSTVVANNNSAHPEPPAPEMCCGMGCANCVWITYGHELVEFYKNQSMQAVENELNKRITDPGVKMFVIGELRQHAANNKQ